MFHVILKSSRRTIRGTCSLIQPLSIGGFALPIVSMLDCVRDRRCSRGIDFAELGVLLANLHTRGPYFLFDVLRAFLGVVVSLLGRPMALVACMLIIMSSPTEYLGKALLALSFMVHACLV